MPSQYVYLSRRVFPTFVLGSLFYGMITIIAALYTISTIHKRNLWRFLEFTGFLVLFALLTAFWSLNLSNILHLLYEERMSDFDSAYDLLSLEQFLGPFALETVFFGSFCTLVALACVVIVRRSLLKSRTHQIMLLVIILMFVVSFVHWLLQAIAVPLNYNPVVGFTFGSEATPVVLLTINVILSDAIVLWRAWVVWGKAKSVLIFSITLLTANFVVSILNIIQIRIADYRSPFTDYFFYGQPSFSDTAFGKAALWLSFVSNVAATVLVGYKAWKYRRRVRDMDSRTPLTVRVVSLLFESGSLYCVLWFLYILISTIIIDIGNTYGADSFTSAGAPAIQWFNHLMPQLTGIYPTIIIVLVSLEEAYGERLRTRSQPSSMVPLTAFTNMSPEETYCDNEITIGLGQPSSSAEGIDSQTFTKNAQVGEV